MRSPSPKIIALFIICISLVASSVIFYENNSTTRDNNLAILSAGNAVTDKDSDNDGLSDDQEKMWSTDPANPDSDGDGVLDGVEIVLGRNPLKKGPDDQLIEVSTSTIDRTPETLTQTDKVSRALLEQFLQKKQLGLQIDSAGESSMVAQAIKDNLNASSSPDYTAKKLNISNDNSAISLKSYGNTLGEAMLVELRDPSKSPWTIFESILIAEDEKKAAELDEYIAAYSSIIKKLLSLKVPSSASTLHLELINSYKDLYVDTVMMKQVNTDPVGAMASYKHLNSSAQRLSSVYKAFPLFFAQKNISFQQGEAGYMWN